MYIRGHKISDISAMHYFKLAFRSFLLIVCSIVYIYGRIKGFNGISAIEEEAPIVFWTVTSIFVFEMALRFFSSNIESPGCQKQFAFNYQPTGTLDAPKIDNQIKTIKVIISWVLLNGIIAAVYFAGLIDQGILILICLAYSVADMICILFFCPFQTWMMKNKCCNTCRIYNWDFIMMFTPCILIDHPMAKVLFFFSLALLIEWEYLYRKYPERFAENTNAYIQCGNCPEKLCSHKKQLQRYLVEFRKHLSEENYNNRLLDNLENITEKIEEIE